MSLGPKKEDKRLIRDYLEKKDALTLDNCIFGMNLLGLGIGESPDDAREALRQGQKAASMRYRSRWCCLRPAIMKWPNIPWA